MAFNFNFGFLALVVLALLSVANAHMKMSSPVPFNVANLDNSPLKADGSDYPCKASPDNPSSYSISAMNNIPVDSAVALTFDGSAVHGGGTCQLSISLDKEPTKDSVFKVIQTYQGSSCPSATGGGLTFNIPKEFPNAKQATLAWSWQNRVGNREMYMNCAPIAITGGSDNGQAYYDSLPDIFKANVPTSDCLTEESTDPSPPNPGAFVLQDSAVKPGKVTGPKCGTAAPAQNQNSAGKATNLAAFSKPAKDSNVIVPVSGGSGTGSGSGSGSGTGGASSVMGGNNGMPSSAPTASYNNGQWTQPAAPPAQPTSAASSSAAPSATVSASSASSAAPLSTFSTLTVPASSATPPAYPTLSPTLGQGVSGPSTGSASPTGSGSSSSGSAGSSSTGLSASNGSPSSSSGSAGSSGQCTTDGAIVCNGPTQFGLCDHGSVVWQAVAAGTTCSNAAILKRSSPVLPRHHARAFHKVRVL